LRQTSVFSLNLGRISVFSLFSFLIVVFSNLPRENRFELSPCYDKFIYSRLRVTQEILLPLCERHGLLIDDPVVGLLRKLKRTACVSIGESSKLSFVMVQEVHVSDVFFQSLPVISDSRSIENKMNGSDDVAGESAFYQLLLSFVVDLSHIDRVFIPIENYVFFVILFLLLIFFNDDRALFSKANFSNTTISRTRILPLGWVVWLWAILLNFDN